MLDTAAVTQGHMPLARCQLEPIDCDGDVCLQGSDVHQRALRRDELRSQSGMQVQAGLATLVAEPFGPGYPVLGLDASVVGVELDMQIVVYRGRCEGCPYHNGEQQGDNRPRNKTGQCLVSFLYMPEYGGRA